MKKKILYIATEPAPGMIPFAATILNTLTEDDRFDIHCICVNRLDKCYKNYLSPKVKASYIEYPNRTFTSFVYKIWPSSLISLINRSIKQIEPDFVHFLTGDYVLGLYYKFFSKKNFCFTVHDLYPHSLVHAKLKDKIVQHLINNGYKMGRDYCDILTSSSNAQIKELRQIYPNKKVSYTPFPTLVTENIKNGTKEVHELKDERGYILFFGTVNKYKGIDLLVDAYKQSGITDNKLVIAGSGVSYEGRNNNIIHVNRFLEDEELRSLFEKAAFVVYPYTSATMSGVLSIAYYFKKKVLLSDIPFFIDNTSPDCTFFKCGNVEDLKVKMMQLNSSGLVGSGEAYDRLYSEKAIADYYYDLYNDKNLKTTI